jgi:hypothetical protein
MTQMMKVLWILALLIPVAALSQTRVHANISFGDNRFYLELSDQYRVPFDDVRYIREAGLPDDDISDILYIYTHSHYALNHIVNLRMRGATWLQLYTWCGIPQDVYYSYRHGPPYGNAYGYYKNHRYSEYTSRDHDQLRYREGHGKHRGWNKHDD